MFVLINEAVWGISSSYNLEQQTEKRLACIFILKDIFPIFSLFSFVKNLCTCLLFRLFHTLSLYVYFILCVSHFNISYIEKFLHFERSGSRTAVQNGDVKKNFARKDAQWIM